jgi:hypothetical protein
MHITRQIFGIPASLRRRRRSLVLEIQVHVGGLLMLVLGAYIWTFVTFLWLPRVVPQYTSPENNILLNASLLFILANT